MSEKWQRFASKVDVWYLLLTVAVLGLTAVIAVASVRAGRMWPLMMSLLPIGLIVWNAASTAYVVTGDSLSVRCLFLRWAVPLVSVKTLRASRDGRAAPALSLDRIEVIYNGGSVLVSPRDKPAFVQAIRAGQPLVRIE